MEDCITYFENTLSSNQTLSVPNLPTNFKAEFKVYRTTSSSNTAWIEVGSNSNNMILFGNAGSTGHMGIFVKINGSYVANEGIDGRVSVNNWTELTYTYNDGVQTITDGTETVTLTNNQITARSYVYFRRVNNSMKELKFKPL